MKKISTLTFLFHQIRSDRRNSEIIGFSDPETGSGDLRTGISHEPPERAVNRILDFAKAFEVADTQAAGKVEWILNWKETALKELHKQLFPLTDFHAEIIKSYMEFQAGEK